MERTERIAGLIEEFSVEELRRTTLQAIDHAYTACAEVAEANAKLQGALGVLGELRDENRRLREALGKRPIRAPGTGRRRSVRATLGRPARWARRRLRP